MKLLWRRGYIDPNKLKLPIYKECVEVTKSITVFTNELSELELNIKKLVLMYFLLLKSL